MFRRKRGIKFDFVLLLTAIIIFGIGLVFLYSATCQRAEAQAGFSQSFIFRQLIWFALGLFIGVVLLKIDYKFWLEWAYLLYGLNLLLLLLVLVWGQGRFGAQRWLSFGNLNFQPSEVSKLVVILTLARYLGQGHRQVLPGAWGKELAVAFLIVGLPFVLIVKQPDLGTALTFIPVLFVLLYVWGLSWRRIALIAAAAACSAPLLWQLLKDYQKRRILVFLNPHADPLGAGYTVIQSKIAIGSGRVFGKGWLAGTQNQLNFLPERHTDFIFSVVAEEWGFLGATLLLVLYLVLIWRAFTIAAQTPSLAGRLLACGIIVMLSFQIVINIAMVMGLVPVVGLPLPLITYGGSSLLVTMISLALLLNIGNK